MKAKAAVCSRASRVGPPTTRGEPGTPGGFGHADFCFVRRLVHGTGLACQERPDARDSRGDLMHRNGRFCVCSPHKIRLCGARPSLPRTGKASSLARPTGPGLLTYLIVPKVYFASGTSHFFQVGPITVFATLKYVAESQNPPSPLVLS